MNRTNVSHVETSVRQVAPVPGPEIWDATAYDAPRRRLVPSFDAFYGTAASLVSPSATSILDLGAGTGLMSAAALEVAPHASVRLLDRSEAMLSQARARLAAHRVTATLAELTDPLPGGPYCAVVSALAIHHLGDADKAALYTRAFDVLKPGGVLVNAEQVAGPTPWHQARYEQMHEATARAMGADDAEWSAAVERMSHDRCTTVEVQLAWLVDAGFEHVDCWFKQGGFAVIAGWRPPS